MPCARLRGWAGLTQGCPCEPSEPWPRVVECRLCDYVSDVLTDDEVAEDLAYDHVVATHPEVEEP